MCNSPLASNKPAKIKINIIEKNHTAKGELRQFWCFTGWEDSAWFLPLQCIILHCTCAWAYPTLWDPMDYTLSGLPLCPWDFPARILEWVAISSSRRSSWPRDGTWVSCIGRWILYHFSHLGSPMYILHTTYPIVSNIYVGLDHCSEKFKPKLCPHALLKSANHLKNSCFQKHLGFGYLRRKYHI